MRHIRVQPLWATLALPGLVMTAAYLLRLVQGTLWGPAPSDRGPVGDLTPRDGLQHLLSREQKPEYPETLFK